MDEHASVYAGRGRLTAGGGRYIALAFDQPPLRPSSPFLHNFQVAECDRMRKVYARRCSSLHG